MTTQLFNKWDFAACLNRLLFILTLTFASQYHCLGLCLYSADLPVCILMEKTGWTMRESDSDRKTEKAIELLSHG